VPVRREVRRRAGQPGDVQVVAARVHDPVDGARVLEARLLLDRQRVHVGAQHHRRSVAVAEHADDAGAADPGRHLEPGGLQPARCDAGGAFLLHRQLRVSVEVLVEVLESCTISSRPSVDVVADGSGMGLRSVGEVGGVDGWSVAPGVSSDTVLPPRR